MNKVTQSLIAFILVLFVTGCSVNQLKSEFNKKGFITPQENNTKVVANAFIKDHIQIKLINNYNEVFALEDVIINYGQTPFDPLTPTLGNHITSSDEEFNKKNIQYSQSGIKESFIGTKYALYTDEALLAMLAKEYGMNIVVYNMQNNKLYTIDFKTSNIILSNKTRHNIYNGFLDTVKYYDDRAQDK